MSFRKIEKSIAKLRVERGGEFQSRDIFLLSDSKGRYLQNEVRPSDSVKICFIYRGGFVINNPEFRLCLHRIRSSTNPIVLVWLGSCEFTQKDKNSKITLKPEIDVTRVVSEYEKFKRDILSFQSSAEVYLIETPTPYINVWNQMHGHEIDENLDKELGGILSYFNEKLRELNSPLKPPSISQDLVQSSKKHTQQLTKYIFNKHLYVDGIHPEKSLAELWLLRFYQFIKRIAGQ